MKTKQLSLVLLSGLCALSATSCKKTNGGNVGKKGAYTYRDALGGTPANWSAPGWTENQESTILSFTTMGLYDFILDKSTGNSYKVVAEMANGDPVKGTLTDEEKAKYYDATTDEAKEKLNTAGYKWTVKLNENAKWEDGTKITANDYIDSLKIMLDKDFKNVRASNYFDGDGAIAHADTYYHLGENIYKASYKDSDDGVNIIKSNYVSVDNKKYFNLYEKLPFYANYSFKKLADTYKEDVVASIKDENKKKEAEATLKKATDLLADEATWGDSKISKWVEITDANKGAVREALNGIIPALFGSDIPLLSESLDISTSETPQKYLQTIGDVCFINVGKYELAGTDPFDSVGLVKNSDYEISIYFTKPIKTDFDFYYNFGAGNFLTKKDIWDKTVTEVGGLKTSKYGTDMANYSSYGPYKISEYQLDKVIKLDRNPNWYGWTDGKHDGQYQTTNIVLEVIKENQALKSKFLAGELDSWSLEASDMKTYGTSSKLKYTPQSFTTKLSINSNLSTLTGNNRLLANTKFREALFWSINRTELAQSQTAGNQAYVSLINTSYVADSATGKLYRDTDEAKKVINDLVGDNLSGYDHDKVVNLVKEAVDESTKKGQYDGGNIKLTWLIYNEGWKTQLQWISDKIVEAMKGTVLEGKLSIELKVDEQCNEKFKAGACDLCITTWGGATFNPYGIPQVYIEDAYKTEPGYNPDDKNDENIYFAVDGLSTGDTAKRTSREWYEALIKGDYSKANATTEDRIKILAAWEYHYLKTYNTLSLYARRSVSMDSFKIKEGTETYNELYGYGGFRFMTYNYDDYDWGNRVNQGLDYTK